MLKLIALFLMVLDHSATFFFPDHVFIMRGIGQIGFPLFCYLTVQGQKHTHDFNQYVINILFCAAITQPLYSSLYPDQYLLNALFTLLFGIILIDLKDKYSEKVFLFLIPLLLFDVVSLYILLFLIIYYFHDRQWYFLFGFSAFFYCVMAYMTGELYLLFSPLYVIFIFYPLPRFNINKYFFYAFYPAHYLIILILK